MKTKKQNICNFLCLFTIQSLLFIGLTAEKSIDPSLVISRRGNLVTATKDTSIQIKLISTYVQKGEVHINFNCTKHGKGYFFIECLDKDPGSGYKGSLRTNEEKSPTYSFSFENTQYEKLWYRIRFIGDNNRYSETKIIKFGNTIGQVK